MFDGDTPDKIAMAALARAAIAKQNEPAEKKPAVRRGAYVADLEVGDMVYRPAMEFGVVTLKEHEVDDVKTGIKPTVGYYVTIKWGPDTSARYTDDTLDWYAVKKVPT